MKKQHEHYGKVHLSCEITKRQNKNLLHREGSVKCSKIFFLKPLTSLKRETERQLRQVTDFSGNSAHSCEDSSYHCHADSSASFSVSSKSTLQNPTRGPCHKRPRTARPDARQGVGEPRCVV